MLIIQVSIHIKPEHLEAFQKATIENGSNSVKEPGIARFDFLQQEDDATRFVLTEVYRDAEAALKHKQTAHYAAWAEAVSGMFVEERTRIRYRSLFPPDGSPDRWGW